MAEDTDDSQKTEEPTQKKRDDARKKGQVAASREVNNWFMIGAGALWIAAFGPRAARDLALVLQKFVESPDAMPMDLDRLRETMLDVLAATGAVLLLPAVIMMAAALAGGP